MLKKVKVVAAKDLSRSVDRAVSVATKRLAIRAEKTTLQLNWEIIGRLLRTKDIDEAFAFADEVSKRVAVGGIVAQPTCCKIDGFILAGFIEKMGLAKQLNF
jgi:hypothetical protein